MRALTTCILDGLENTLATPLRLVAITELDSLVGTGRGTRWNDGAVKTGLGDEVLVSVSDLVLRPGSVRYTYDFDGWVTTRVIDTAGVDLGDSHDCRSVEDRRSVTVASGAIAVVFVKVQSFSCVMRLQRRSAR